MQSSRWHRANHPLLSELPRKMFLGSFLIVLCTALRTACLCACPERLVIIHRITHCLLARLAVCPLRVEVRCVILPVCHDVRAPAHVLASSKNFAVGC